jgi:hypothetical protein
MGSPEPYPIVRQPAPGTRTPILVSVPHNGTEPLPHVTREDYGEPRFETFAYGFADTFVGDLYGDLHEHGATVLATPYSRMFVDVNRRRDDFEEHDGEDEGENDTSKDSRLLGLGVERRAQTGCVPVLPTLGGLRRRVVAVESDEPRRPGFEQRAGVAAETDRTVDEEAAVFGAEKLQDLGGHDRHVHHQIPNSASARASSSVYGSRCSLVTNRS